MYKAGDQFPLVEEDAVSDSNDARQIEVYLANTGLPYTFFRPQVQCFGAACLHEGRRWWMRAGCVCVSGLHTRLCTYRPDRPP